ncbi:hypothetical protein [uncultured Arthrobacter sp.]|uniref:hypothetical protein n=1 Tax=uncultured Arthrobacter sp. TaxID=114050 RepID=UPI003217F1A1
MVAVLGGSRAPTPESSLHLAQAAGPRHSLPALLAAETPDRVPASDIAGVDDRRNNEQNNEEYPREGNRSQNAVDKAAKDAADG